MRVRAEESKVTLDYIPDDRMPDLTFDPEGLHRAILNVLTNGIDACDGRGDGRVEIRTAILPDQELARVVVQDNGIGIPTEDLDRVFKVFESHKGSRGTGLGLSVSQKILREHGGEILLESEPDAGSQFTLQFPALPAEDQLETIVPDG